MADHVNLRETEYSTIITEVETLHRQQKVKIGSIIAQIKVMVSNEGAFYADGTSKKITDLLDTFLQEILPIMNSSFEECENGIERMIQTMETMDTP